MSELPPILQRVQAKGFAAFESGAWNVNIVGVRSPSRIPNDFDDRLHLVYKDEFGAWQDHNFRITTDPGTYWLDHPSRVEGTAILVPGQYRGAYKIDKHRGKYDALCQRAGKVKVYRDGNKDEILDQAPETITEGYFGINIHHASHSGESTEVNRWSAGCQVFSDILEWNIFMAVIWKAAETWGSRFSYTLLED